MKMHHVQVVVPHREGFAGVGAAKRFWPEGVTEADLSEAELSDMFHRPTLMILEGGKHVKAMAGLKGYVRPTDLKAAAHERAKMYSAEAIAQPEETFSDDVGAHGKHEKANVGPHPLADHEAFVEKDVDEAFDTDPKDDALTDTGTNPDALSPVDTSVPFPPEPNDEEAGDPLAEPTTELDTSKDAQSGKKKHGKRF